MLQPLCHGDHAHLAALSGDGERLVTGAGRLDEHETEQRAASAIRVMGRISGGQGQCGAFAHRRPPESTASGGRGRCRPAGRQLAALDEVVDQEGRADADRDQAEVAARFRPPRRRARRTARCRRTARPGPAAGSSSAAAASTPGRRTRAAAAISMPRSIAASRSLWLRLDDVAAAPVVDDREHDRDQQRHDDRDDGDEYGNDVFVHGRPPVWMQVICASRPQGCSGRDATLRPARAYKAPWTPGSNTLWRRAGMPAPSTSSCRPTATGCSASPIRSCGNAPRPRTPPRRPWCGSGRRCPGSTAAPRSAPGSTPSRAIPA